MSCYLDFFHIFVCCEGILILGALHSHPAIPSPSHRVTPPGPAATRQTSPSPVDIRYAAHMCTVSPLRAMPLPRHPLPTPSRRHSLSPLPPSTSPPPSVASSPIAITCFRCSAHAHSFNTDWESVGTLPRTSPSSSQGHDGDRQLTYGWCRRPLSSASSHRKQSRAQRVAGNGPIKRGARKRTATRRSRPSPSMSGSRAA